ncbi:MULTISPECIES: histidine phosphatase family protein [Myroides]|uniref:Alpha-ribazole phosphatase n=1 Tax=Myroides albus TaxID=2562892 RepID=A0A6I3LKG7_9FLAO|nr:MULTISPECIES: histidine phosphatase family protein [Myroides]MTG97740.1 alpha-ribazole phosphatase [Myroides albus]MVX34910.1 alpha-ribazole phosphatase [Myroides sp. LoEW2-1]UVD78711.1 histidine phosphatase family protein [Myroides albus]
MQVYVIRHTAVEIQAGTCYGQTDLNLLNSYRDDLLQVRKQLPKAFDAIFSSPLKRCTFIAEEFDSKYQTDSRLIEMNFGHWEMANWSEIPKQEIDLWNSNLTHNRPPQGESLYEVQSRVNHFLDELRTQSFKNVLLITHGGPIRCMWNYILDIPLENTFRIPVGFDEVFTFQLGEEHSEDFIIAKQ